VPYRVLVAPAARREVKKLPRTVQALIIEVLRDLASDPRPTGCKQLSGPCLLYTSDAADE